MNNDKIKAMRQNVAVSSLISMCLFSAIIYMLNNLHIVLFYEYILFFLGIGANLIKVFLLYGSNKNSEKWFSSFKFSNYLVSFSWGTIFLMFSIKNEGLNPILFLMLLSVIVQLSTNVLNLNIKKFETSVSNMIMIVPVLLAIANQSSVLFVFKITLFIVVLSVFLIASLINLNYNKEWNEGRDQREEIQEVVDSFPGGISLIENSKYKMINKTIVDMTGINSKNILNNIVGNNNPEDNLVIALKEFSDSKLLVMHKEIELSIKNEVKTFFLILKKIKENKILAITIDISEEQKLKEELDRQKIKLQNAAKLASLGEMASGISHEINNPLQVIGGRAELLQEEMNEYNDQQLDPDLKERIVYSLKAIEQMSVRIAKIIKGLKTFARNADDDPFVECSLNDIINDTLSFCQQRFYKHNIDFQYNNETDFIVKAKATQISQVLLNLLGNSFDAVMESTKSDKMIILDISGTEDSIVMKVKDNGVGVSESFKNKIMMPFQTTKPVGKGTGLGLSISKSIAADHNGDLFFNFDTDMTEVVLVLPKMNNSK